MDRPKLNSHMALHSDTQKSLAESLGLSLSRLNAKLNQTCGAEFTLSEMMGIVRRYGLTPEEGGAIFFTEEVS